MLILINNNSHIMPNITLGVKTYPAGYYYGQILNDHPFGLGVFFENNGNARFGRYSAIEKRVFQSERKESKFTHMICSSGKKTIIIEGIAYIYTDGWNRRAMPASLSSTALVPFFKSQFVLLEQKEANQVIAYDHFGDVIWTMQYSEKPSDSWLYYVTYIIDGKKLPDAGYGKHIQFVPNEPNRIFNYSIGRISHDFNLLLDYPACQWFPTQGLVKLNREVVYRYKPQSADDAPINLLSITRPQQKQSLLYIPPENYLYGYPAVLSDPFKQRWIHKDDTHLDMNGDGWAVIKNPVHPYVRYLYYAAKKMIWRKIELDGKMSSLQYQVDASQWLSFEMKAGQPVYTHHAHDIDDVCISESPCTLLDAADFYQWVMAGERTDFLTACVQGLNAAQTCTLAKIILTQTKNVELMEVIYSACPLFVESHDELYSVDLLGAAVYPVLSLLFHLQVQIFNKKEKYSAIFSPLKDLFELLSQLYKKTMDSKDFSRSLERFKNALPTDLEQHLGSCRSAKDIPVIQERLKRCAIFFVRYMTIVHQHTRANPYVTNLLTYIKIAESIATEEKETWQYRNRAFQLNMLPAYEDLMRKNIYFDALMIPKEAYAELLMTQYHCEQTRIEEEKASLAWSKDAYADAIKKQNELNALYQEELNERNALYQEVELDERNALYEEELNEMRKIRKMIRIMKSHHMTLISEQDEAEQSKYQYVKVQLTLLVQKVCRNFPKQAMLSKKQAVLHELKAALQELAASWYAMHIEAECIAREALYRTEVHTLPILKLPWLGPFLLLDRVQCAFRSLYAALNPKNTRMYFVGSGARNLLQGTPMKQDNDIHIVVFTTELIGDGRRLGLVADRYIPHLYRHPIYPNIDYYVVTVEDMVNCAYLHDDMKTRDFTINTFYCNPMGRVFNPDFRGIHDLRSKTIRTILSPQDSFQKDPVRILRAIKLIVEGYKPSCCLDDAMKEVVIKNKQAHMGHIMAVLKKHIRGFELVEQSHYLRLLENYGLLKKFFVDYPKCIAGQEEAWVFMMLSFIDIFDYPRHAMFQPAPRGSTLPACAPMPVSRSVPVAPSPIF